MKMIELTQKEKDFHTRFWLIWSINPRPLSDWADWLCETLDKPREDCIKALEEHHPEQFENPYESLEAVYCVLDSMGVDLSKETL